MKSSEWKTYRTRFLVKAKQLTSTLSFIDHLGRQHCGRKGDYLVESSEGVISIAPRHIFEDIYVRMSEQAGDVNHKLAEAARADELDDACLLAAERLSVERIEPSQFQIPTSQTRRGDAALSPRAHRKSPQPVRGTPSRLGLM